MDGPGPARPVSCPDQSPEAMTQTQPRPRPADAQGQATSTTRKPPTLAVPERPKLAPGVKLAGQMKESAFEDPPWLIEREDGGYIQVNELLYRIAEQCDGRHTVQEIAANVSDGAGPPIGA